MPKGTTHSALSGGGLPGTAGKRSLDADVVGTGRAAADADALAAPHQAVVGRPAGHGQIEVGALQLLDRPAPAALCHWFSTRATPLAQRVRLEDAAVEQHRRRLGRLLLAALRAACASASTSALRCRNWARCLVMAGSLA